MPKKKKMATAIPKSKKRSETVTGYAAPNWTLVTGGETTGLIINKNKEGATLVEVELTVTEI